MPTITTLFGWRVVVYPNDHRPAHVHLIGAGLEAVFDLNCPGGPPALRENYGFSRRDLQRAADALGKQLTSLCEAWSRIHGSY